MLIDFGLIVMFVVFALIVIFAALFLWGAKYAFVLGINSIIGFFALYAVKAWLLPSLVINFWSVIVVAIFGIIGFIVVLVLHLLGAAF